MDLWGPFFPRAKNSSAIKVTDDSGDNEFLSHFLADGALGYENRRAFDSRAKKGL